MPCRTRGFGLDVEGLGIVFLEASASGLPVIAGRSGGAPETVRPGRTGMVVDGRDVGELADAVGGLLADPDRAAAWGANGRAWVTRAWNWDGIRGPAGRAALRADRSHPGADPLGRVIQPHRIGDVAHRRCSISPC